MCLSTVDESYDHPSTLILDGWKSFSGSSAKPKFESFAIGGSTDVPLDKWIQATGENAKGKDIAANNGKPYKPGFHVYADEAELKSNKAGLRRVFVRNITCLGRQDGRKCVIAQQMYVPSDANGWPPKPEEDKSLLDRLKNIVPGRA